MLAPRFSMLILLGRIDIRIRNHIYHVPRIALYARVRKAYTHRKYLFYSTVLVLIEQHHHYVDARNTYT